jgi:anthranilate phosphoribosyltransferase
MTAFSPPDIKRFVKTFRLGGSIDESSVEDFFAAVVSTSNEANIVELLEAWDAKGVSENELEALTRFMRSRMKTLAAGRAAIDIVGTGGSSSKTFNVSTAAALVCAGAGLRVAKHGNRAASSSSGSSDVLGELGVRVDLDVPTAERCLDELGICFMFAPYYHTLSPTLAAGRRTYGRPTIFNNVGPLCNPAGVDYQLLGVWSPEWQDRTAQVINRLGTVRSWVVRGHDGLDEITLRGQTDVFEIRGGQIGRFTVSASDFGLVPDSRALPRVQTSSESADLILSVLRGEMRDEAAEQVVVMNAAAAIYIFGGAPDLPAAARSARDSIASGAALDKLYRLREVTAV